MKTNKAMISRKKSVTRIMLVTAFILSIPLIAMQFTSEVKWDLKDFIVIGGLLIGTGLVYDHIARTMDNPTHRAILAAVMLLAVFVMWVELAVGIFD